MSRGHLALIKPEDPIETIMRSPVATVTEDATLAEVIDTLAANEIGALAVVRHDHVLGIVSERDVISRLAAGADPDSATAAEMMSTGLLSVGPQEPIISAAQRVNAAEVRHLPVLDEAGELLGFLSIRDLMTVLVAAIPSQ